MVLMPPSIISKLLYPEGYLLVYPPFPHFIHFVYCSAFIHFMNINNIIYFVFIPSARILFIPVIFMLCNLLYCYAHPSLKVSKYLGFFLFKPYNFICIEHCSQSSVRLRQHANIGANSILNVSSLFHSYVPT